MSETVKRVLEQRFNKKGKVQGDFFKLHVKEIRPDDLMIISLVNEKNPITIKRSGFGVTMLVNLKGAV